MIFRLRDVAQVWGIAGDWIPDVPVTGWSADTRTLQPGDLFFALRGPNFDGHDFAAQAREKGACAMVADRPAPVKMPVLRVDDVLEALQRLAGWARLQWQGRLIAVTGSAGKTTTKELIARFLEDSIPVGKSPGNLNNHIGLPLSILRLPERARVAVAEMGMNHAGEIRRLASVARPDVGVVTNVGHAHIENFDSIEGVALAKRELIESLPASGVAVLNADDPWVIRFGEIHNGKTVTFGLAEGADMRAEEVVCGPEGVRFRLGDLWLESPLTGVHSVLNLLAALAVAREFGIEPAALRDSIASLFAAEMRGRRFLHREITVIDDCYNSNPEAALTMLKLLCDQPARRRMAALGEMRELGRWSEALHRDVGRHAAACGIDLLVGVGGAAVYMIEEALRAGMPAGAALFFEDAAEAGRFLKSRASAGDAVLFKGSRGIRMEKALETFLG